MLQPDLVATAVPGVDPRAHAHTPLQAFVLTHVDGRRSIVELSTITGVTASVIAALVARLIDERVLRVVDLVDDDELESQRPTVPGEFDFLAHDRPTRPIPID